MRFSAVRGLIGLVGAAALAWGWSLGREPVPARPSDLTTAVPAAWYADLPLDPVATTNAYLARIPAAMRERGESYSDTRMLTFNLRVLSLIAATIVLCATRMAAQARARAACVVSSSLLVDITVALQYFTALYLLSLPVEIYATFLRPRRFGFSDQSFIGWLGDSLINWGVFTAFYLIGVLVIYRFIRTRPAHWVNHH